MQALTVVAEPETDGAWVEVLPFWTIDELQREARKTKARELERRDEGRYVRSSHTRDERWGRLEAQLHPEELAALLAAIDQEIPAHARLTDMDRYAADGLMALVRQELGTAQRPDRATVVVHVRAATLRGDDGAAQVASLEAGGYVSEETARRLACDCRAEFVAWDAFTQAVGIARASRVVPPYLYRQLRYRDGCCVFPGCGRTGYLHAHHIVHWALRGKTELDNLVLVCTEHHQLVHEYGWSLRGRAGPHIRWIRPDGTVFAPRVPAYADSS
jgi:5-methylcytosine-specific restriction endonuclease McrA